ncbi:hypothetical protein BGZ82_001825 [Podila clonocystis]|nr:hypothetical protein BGZ82_001825 [Podila clonocystis]
MSAPQVPLDPIPTLLLLGNAGAGKSTLLTQLGGTKFGSGVKFRRGFTKDVTEERVELKGQSVRLIDVPGLFEPNNGQTEFNAKQLTDALGRKNYRYRLYFVLEADNRGPGDKEMVMMSRINECVKKADGSRMSFGVIVNQVQSKAVEAMYEELAEDRFQSMFAKLIIPGFKFNIDIDSVIMLPFDEQRVEQHQFGSELAGKITMSQATAIKLESGISFCNHDLKHYETGCKGLDIQKTHSEPTLLYTPAPDDALQGAFQQSPMNQKTGPSTREALLEGRDSV